MKNANLLALAGAVAMAAATLTSHASLIEASPFPIDVTGTGLGAVDTVLTITSPANTTSETGSVFAVGAGEGTSGDTIAINHVRTFSNTASNLRVVFNPNEPQNNNDGITLQNLVLTAFDAGGSARFTSGVFTPVGVTAADAGTGKAGFVFQLDSAQASQLQTAIDTFGANRIGLQATGLNATGGPETFFLTAVPEPGTWALLVAGLVGMAGVVRRRV